MRVATVDLGTNTALLLVAEKQASGALTALLERATITRLGEGVDRARRLAPAAIERTLACLEDYSRIAREFSVERVAVAGTSAMRDAAGGEEFRRRVGEIFGVEPRVLSGDEEARLTFRGALSGLAVGAGTEVGVFDIGGGSTEVVLGSIGGSAQLRFARSFDVGSVRLTERHGENRAELRAAALAAFAAVPPLPAGGPPVGIAGTMTTLAAVFLELEPYDGARVHGYTLSRDKLASVVDRIASLDLESRRHLRGMEPKRADVIVAGGVLATALLEHWDAREVQVSDRGVRWGLAAELAG